MIIYRKKPFKPNMKNIIMLDAGMTDGYIYVSKDTYEQAVAIAVTFSKDHERIERALGKTIDGWKITPGIFTVFRKISEGLPEPINMLSTFIGLATDAGIEWKADATPEEMCELACGVLHTISQFADFYAMTLVPADQRAKLDIPKHVYKGYHESWETLINDLESHVVTVSSDEIHDVVKAAVEGCIGDTVDAKIKSGLEGIELPSATPAEIDKAQIESIVERMVAEKINAFIGSELPRLVSQQVQSSNHMMGGYQQMPMYQPQMNPYQQMPMYQLQMMQPQQMVQPQVVQQPIQQVVQPVQQVVQSQVEVQPIPQSNPVATVSNDAPDALKNAEIVEGENVVDPDEIAALMASINAEFDEKLEQDKKKFNEENASSDKPKVQATPQILTEDVRKEKNIAEESQKIINSYDL